jgi:multicomponent Na+:H+ antiporter subunit F
MELVTTICFALLAAAALLCVLRVVRDPAVSGRVIALDTLLITSAVGIAVLAARTGSGRFLDALLVVALVAFIGTTAVARFIERKGAR